MKLTGIVISKNEEKMIADCLDSLAFCDEVLVIDNNSTDRTPEIAKQMKAKVISSDSNDFANLRNLGLKEASGDYVLYIDSDERISDQLSQEIKMVISKNEFSAFSIPRKNFYLGKNEWPKTENMIRLFRKDSLRKWYGALHESPEYEGRLGSLQNFIFHYTHRDLTSMLNKTIEWSDIEAKTRYDANHPLMSWWRFPRVMIPIFLNSYILQKGWKLGTAGFIESVFQSYSTFITYSKLWEMQQKKKS